MAKKAMVFKKPAAAVIAMKVLQKPAGKKPAANVKAAPKVGAKAKGQKPAPVENPDSSPSPWEYGRGWEEWEMMSNDPNYRPWPGQCAQPNDVRARRTKKPKVLRAKRS